MQIENYCGLTSDLDLSETHCSILLTVTPQVDQLLLDWSDYIGWDDVEEYEIYRVNDYSTTGMSLIATIPGNQTAFTDTNMFCYDDFTYRIQAKELSSEEISWSNIQNEAPIHFGPQNPMHMSLATVKEDSFIWISWEDLPRGDDLTWVEIERNSGMDLKEFLDKALTIRRELLKIEMLM